MPQQSSKATLRACPPARLHCQAQLGLGRWHAHSRPGRVYQQTATLAPCLPTYCHPGSMSTGILPPCLQVNPKQSGRPSRGLCAQRRRCTSVCCWGARARRGRGRLCWRGRSRRRRRRALRQHPLALVKVLCAQGDRQTVRASLMSGTPSNRTSPGMVRMWFTGTCKPCPKG